MEESSEGGIEEDWMSSFFRVSQERKFSGDMYAFNLDHHSWRKFLNRVSHFLMKKHFENVIQLTHRHTHHPQGERVPEREVHVATAVRNKVVVFGGHTGNFIYPNEFYFYELGKMHSVHNLINTQK